MFNLRPAQFLMPGLMLLIIGIGNSSVGYYKQDQYEVVIAELAELPSTPGLVHASPLQRIQLAKVTADRRYERLNIARGRRDFYRLVNFGGQVFIGVSLVLFALGASLSLRQKSAP